jgi:hypothetical protein
MQHFNSILEQSNNIEVDDFILKHIAQQRKENNESIHVNFIEGNIYSELYYYMNEKENWKGKKNVDITIEDKFLLYRILLF